VPFFCTRLHHTSALSPLSFRSRRRAAQVFLRVLVREFLAGAEEKRVKFPRVG